MVSVSYGSVPVAEEKRSSANTTRQVTSASLPPDSVPCLLAGGRAGRVLTSPNGARRAAHVGWAPFRTAGVGDQRGRMAKFGRTRWNVSAVVQREGCCGEAQRCA